MNQMIASFVSEFLSKRLSDYSANPFLTVPFEHEPVRKLIEHCEAMVLKEIAEFDPKDRHGLKTRWDVRNEYFGWTHGADTINTLCNAKVLDKPNIANIHTHAFRELADLYPNRMNYDARPTEIMAQVVQWLDVLITCAWILIKV